jgi:mono/diheme cytochrome c family protein
MRYFFLIFILSVLAVVGMAGFRGSKSRQPPIQLFNDMQNQNKVRPQSASGFFPDQRSARVRPEGTVPQSTPYELNGEVVKIKGNPVYPYEDVPMNTGRVPGTTNFIEVNPVPFTHQLLDRGQERFQIYCLPCHGPAGDGKGIVAKYGLPAPADFHAQRLVEMGDGEIFNSMSYGKNNMPAYAAIIPVQDRWAIISYVRVLQRSQLATMDEVPDAARAALKK